MQSRELEIEFEKQIGEHTLLLHKVCRLYAFSEADREDLFQEIIIQLWQAYPRFEGKSRFSTWLYRIAINTAITGLRKNKRMVTSYEPASLPANITDDGSSAAAEERLQQLYTAIAKLNEVERAVVMLYMEERSYDEMEDILGISNSTLRVKMNRIKEKLRDLTKTINHGT